MKKIVIALFCIMLCLSSAIGFAYPVKPDFSLLPTGTNISVVAQYLSGKKERLFSHQSKQMRIPASTQKIITGLAALLELGPEFRFTTSFATQGHVHLGKLRGDLILVMNGDPTFTRQNLQKMITDLKARGIKRISGNIVINTSIFAGHDKAVGWSWNNLTQCYNTAPSASIIDGNCFYASIAPSKTVGAKASIITNAYYPVRLHSEVITTSRYSDNRYCELDVIAKDNNNYVLNGCIKLNDPKRYLHFAVTDGPRYIADILRSQLAGQNIDYNGEIIFSKQPMSGNIEVLSAHQSPQLSILLTEMLKYSNNLIADTVFRTIGAHHFNMPGTWRNSSDAVRRVLKNKANINIQNTLMADGSGLSRLNLINAETMLKILEYIATHDSELHMMKMFPVAGVDGTLRNRNSLRTLPFRTNIIAKTGYLEGSYNLAGFIKTKSNHYIAFVQFSTGYNQAYETNQMRQSSIVTFENTLYYNALKYLM